MKKLLSLFIAAIIMLANITVIADSAYTASDWAKDELLKAEEMNLIPDRLMNENLKNYITREEFAAITVKLYEYLSNSEVGEFEEKPFTDTQDEDVIAAYNLGFTTGVASTKFAPNEFLSREQAATMLLRVYKKLKYANWTIYTDDNFKPEYKYDETFADDADISSWSKDAVYFMAANGLIKGVGNNCFAPKNVTKEQKESGYANTTREAALLIAARMTALDIEAVAGEKTEPETVKNDYTVAFIGGSLTEGGGTWQNAVKKCITEHDKDKNVIVKNAGKGGTASDYGAGRFMEDVGMYKPDMVFVEFAVNDHYFTEENGKIYMESIVRQCLSLEKVPSVIFIYAPRPCEKTSEDYAKWANVVRWKEEVAKHYGIKSINVYDYMQSDYDNIKKGKGYKTFTEYLSTMYNKSGSGFDVHGGYTKYAEAIKKAFDEDYSGFMNSKPYNASIYCEASKAIVEATYKQIPATDERVSYEGNWKIHDKSSKYVSTESDFNIGDKQYSYPYFPKGVVQTFDANTSFEFKTNASAVAISYIASNKGNDADVYVDGKKVGIFSCNVVYTAVNYLSPFVNVSNDNKEHTVKVVVNNPTESKCAFRFGAIVEKYNK